MTIAPREPTPGALRGFAAVLSAMDGTLVDTEHLWFDAGRDLMLDLGISRLRVPCEPIR